MAVLRNEAPEQEKEMTMAEEAALTSKDSHFAAPAPVQALDIICPNPATVEARGEDEDGNERSLLEVTEEDEEEEDSQDGVEGGRRRHRRRRRGSKKRRRKTT